jgi:Zn-dependent metalloprotease
MGDVQGVAAATTPPTATAAPKVPAAPRILVPARQAAAPAPAPLEVYKSNGALEGQRELKRSTGQGAVGDGVVDRAFENATKVSDYYQSKFGRNGVDGKGGTLRVTVNDPQDNASFDPRTKELAFGTSEASGKAYGDALDVVAHEYTHGVMDASVKLPYSGQSGGLDESFADVIGTVIDADDWQVGEDVTTGGIRDLSNPVYKTRTDIPVGMAEPHAMAHVPNHAAYKVGTAVGKEAMGQIWYRAMTGHLTQNSGYAGAARATITAAAELFGQGSAQHTAVTDAWKAVGVNPGWTSARRSRFDRAMQQVATLSPKAAA